ncbi:MAG: carbon-nitrogen hydrolase family protein, partial [Longimicrobiales bacterium]
AGADKNENIAMAGELIGRATGLGATLVSLPETWEYMGDSALNRANAEPVPGPLTDRLAEIARRHRVWLHAGSIHEITPDEPRVYNTTVVFDPDGNIIGAYRKIHLYDVAIGDDVLSRESATVAPGDEVVVIDVAGVKLGLSICYDLRFPELYRLLALQGAEVVVVPAAFHYHTGKDHWEVLLRARAIENQVFVLAANACGSHPGGWKSHGRSMVVDPWGIVLATAGDGPGVCVAECDLDVLERVRRELPSLANRRPAAYRWTEDALVVS